MTRYRLMAATAGAAVILIVTVAIAAQATGDDSWLRNFRIGDSPEETRDRTIAATGGERPVDVEPGYTPSPNNVPYRFGVFYLVPEAWVGPLEPVERLPDAVGLRPGHATDDLDVLRTSTLWRELEVEDFDLTEAFAADPEFAIDQSYSQIVDGKTKAVIELLVKRPSDRPIEIPIVGEGDPSDGEYETLTIEGHDTVVWDPLPADNPLARVYLFDESTQVLYVLSGANVDPETLMSLVRTLYK
jgi:hypothetical protein